MCTTFVHTRSQYNLMHNKMGKLLLFCFVFSTFCVFFVNSQVKGHPDDEGPRFLALPDSSEFFRTFQSVFCLLVFKNN